jgi:hypothetical protein
LFVGIGVPDIGPVPPERPSVALRWGALGCRSLGIFALLGLLGVVPGVLG